MIRENRFYCDKKNINFHKISKMRLVNRIQQLKEYSTEFPKSLGQSEDVFLTIHITTWYKTCCMVKRNVYYICPWCSSGGPWTRSNPRANFIRKIASQLSHDWVSTKSVVLIQLVGVLVMWFWVNCLHKKSQSWLVLSLGV